VPLGWADPPNGAAPLSSPSRGVAPPELCARILGEIASHDTEMFAHA